VPTMTPAASPLASPLASTMSAAASPADWRVPATPELLASIVAREPDREVSLQPADRTPADAAEPELAEDDVSSSSIRFVTVSQPGKATATVVLPSFDGGAAADDLLLDDEDALRPTGLAAFAALVRRRRTPLIATGAAGAALLLLAMTTGFARSSDDQPMVRAYEPDAQLRTPQPATTSVRAVTSSAGTIDSATHVGPSIVAMANAPAESRPSRERAASRGEAREAKPEAASAGPAAALPSLGALPSAPDLARAVQNAVGMRADSLMRAGGSSAVARLSVLDAPRRNGVATTVPPQLIGSIPTPKFPAALREKRFDGMVVVEFMVDTTGAPIASTISVVQSNHAAFSDAVRAVVPRMRFVPAQSDGRPTTGRVRVPFEFAL
jgi:TonB family protein